MTTIIIGLLAAATGSGAAGWVRERRRHNATIRRFGRALASATRPGATVAPK